MAKRKVIGLLGFGTGLFAGSVLYRRTVGRRSDRVELYFADGAMATYAEGSQEGDELLPIARDLIAAARR